jgi:hypothetical protein
MAGAESAALPALGGWLREHRPRTEAALTMAGAGAAEGQALLSACWAAVGVGALAFGLRRNFEPARNFALGLLLLTGGLAYRRLRPPPAPDLRSVPRVDR